MAEIHTKGQEVSLTYKDWFFMVFNGSVCLRLPINKI